MSDCLLEGKMLMITIVHFEGAHVTWKGQVRFVMSVDQPNTINIENSEVGVLLELSSHELYLKKRFRVSSTIVNVK